MTPRRLNAKRRGSAGRTGNAPRRRHLAARLGRSADVWLERNADVGFVLLAAVLATLPLLLRGASCGHDLSFHLLNWMEVATQWTGGTARPIWAFHAAWNAGEPRFVFYPPLSWALGALLGLLLPWAATPIAYTLVALALSGLTMRVLLRRFVAPTIATAGACVYVANPYMLFVAYERTAFAELLAAAWMPLLLLAVLRMRVQPLRLAGALALLWLTNAPAAVVGCYALLVLALVRLVRNLLRQGFPAAAREAGSLLDATLLGLALAGFFLVPALVQRRFVQIGMAVLPGMRPADSFLFGHTSDAFHDAVLRSASWIAVAILTVALGCITALWLRWRTGKPLHTDRSMHSRQVDLRSRQIAERKSALPLLACLSLVILFLLTRFSAPVWRHAPELAFLQFPWRFLSIEAAVATMLAALLAASLTGRDRRTLRMALAAALLFAAIMPWAGNALYRQGCDDGDTPAAQRARYINDLGSEPTDEYTPVAADNDALHPNLPGAWLTSVENGAPNTSTLAEVVSIDDGHADHLNLQVRAAPRERALVVRLRQFSGWSLQLDGKPQPTTSTRDDGLITVDLSPDTVHQVELRYHWTVDEYAGLGLSVAAMLLLVFLHRKRPMQVPPAKPAT